MKKINKEKLFTTVLIVLLVGIFVGIFSYGLDSVLAMEGSFPPNVLTEGLTSPPQTKEAAVEFLNTVIDKAVEEKPKMDTADNFEVDTDTLETSGSEQLKQTLIYAVDDFDSQLDSNFEGVSTDFGEDIKDLLNVPQIAAEDITDFSCDYIFYQCSSCGEESDIKHPECEVCGSVYEYLEKYRDEYTITLTVENTEEILVNDFGKRSTEEAIALCGDGFDGTLEISDLDIIYDELKVVFKVQRTTNKITYLDYQKNMSVDTEVKFTNSFRSLGQADVSFKIQENNSVSFTWPGLSLSAKEKSVEPKGSDNLLATLTCTNPLDYTVTWESSDESIVTVDEEGYFDATKKTGTAVITASFEFNGVKYSDQCTVSVKYSAESSKMKEKEIALSVGETHALEVTVLPKETTIKTVKWYSEDESIATVDENGVVTAVASGEVVVYSLTDDGYFKSSCEVTVK